MENIQPWCISRQLWWGHQIPAWYGPDGKVFVELRPKTRHREARTTRDGESPEEANGAHGKDIAAHPRRGRARHLVLLRAVAVLDARLAGQDAGGRALLSDLHAGHRLRHHLLLGRPHDDDGPALHEGGALQGRLHPPSRPRREGRQDVEVEGQRGRPARHHRRLRRRRAALHAGARRGAGPRHPALAADRREQPQLRDQAVERGALRRVQRRGARRRLRSEVRQGDAQPLDRARDRQGRARDHRGAGAAQVQRRGERGLSLRLERLLRLVRRAVEAVPDRPGRRGEGRDARHRRLGAR